MKSRIPHASNLTPPCAAALSTMLFVAAHASAFTVGNIVVVRVGDGTTGLSSNCAPVFLDEYTQAGVLVGTTPLPTTSVGTNHRLTLTGNNGFEGFLSVTEDGNYLTLGGYDLAPGLPLDSSVTRVLARVDMNGAVDTTTKIVGEGGSLRCVASFDGSGFWAATSNGCIFTPYGGFLGQPVSGVLFGFRAARLFGDQLYVSSQTSGMVGISTCGSGMNTGAAQSVALLGGFAANSAAISSDFYFADSTTVYIIDERSVSAGGGIQKWVLNGTTWSLAYTLNGVSSSGPLAPNGCRSLTGKTVAGLTTLFARATGPIVAVTDNGNVASSPFTTIIASAGTNRSFRGISSITGSTAVYGCTEPNIVIQPPTAVTQCASTFATIGVTALGSGIGYQWHQSIDGGLSWTAAATTSSSGFNSALLTSFAAANNTRYRCVVTTPCGSIMSTTCTLNTVAGTAPSVPFTQPSVHIGAGQQAALFASAAAGQTIDWFRGGEVCGVEQIGSGSLLIVDPLVNTVYHTRARNLSTGCLSGSCASAAVQITPYSPVVVSQFYGAANGFNPPSTYNRNYIELYNRSASPVDLSDYSLQFTTNGNTSIWNALALPGIIPAHGYYLVSVGAAGAIGADLPAPDASFGDNSIAATEGRIALVKQLTPMSGGCFLSSTSNVMDLVGWNHLTICYEGIGPAPANISNQHSTGRLLNGLQDTNNNSVDFVSISPPSPRNTASEIVFAPPTGACCLGDGGCAMMSEVSCIGVYLGDFTVCGASSYHATTRAMTLDDISTQSPATVLASGGAGTITVTLPFDFLFFGIPKTQVSICRHGWMAFTPTNSESSSPVSLPSPSAPNDILAPFWKFLSFSPTGRVYSLTKGTVPNRRFIVQWDKLVSNGNLTTFQAVLWESTNAIEFRYAAVDHNSAFIGVENRLGNIGFQIPGFHISSGGAAVGKLLLPTAGCAVSGACCILGSCTMTNAYACQQTGGVFHGYTSLCTSGTCCAATVADVNDDNLVDSGDIFPFVEVLLGDEADPLHLTRSDVNCDGRADGLDIEPFVVRLLP